MSSQQTFPDSRAGRLAAFLLLVCAAIAGLLAVMPSYAPQLIRGIVWQVDNATLHPRGDWQRLGVRELLVQWSAVDDRAFITGSSMPVWPELPDWRRIGREPWAESVILGLAGRFSENETRSGIDQLAQQSHELAKVSVPVRVSGHYFPAEVDPSWTEARRLATLLQGLPRPLWISLYDSRNVGAQTTADWIASWLPPDIGVFFQDGVGVEARSPPVARHYADALAAKLGKDRVRVIVEAFRPKVGGGFRSATASELMPQIRAMRGYDIYLFDGPHYVDRALVDGLLAADQ